MTEEKKPQGNQTTDTAAKAAPPTDDAEKAEQKKALAEAIIELNSSVKYWDMAQTHSCIYPM